MCKDPIRWNSRITNTINLVHHHHHHHHLVHLLDIDIKNMGEVSLGEGESFAIWFRNFAIVDNGFPLPPTRHIPIENATIT